MNTISAIKQRAQPAPAPCLSTAFGCPRDFLNNRFVYTVVSARARGLSVGVNMNPDKRCNFDCIYCEVDRTEPTQAMSLDVGAMILELERTLETVHSGRIRQRPDYQRLPADLLQLRHVAFSGDGEPTLCPNFLEAVEAVIHLRARGPFPFFKLVLITNASGLGTPAVEQGLRLFTPRDEVWAKFEAGTPDYLERVNKADRPMEQTLASILNLARRRPVIIQSLFPAINGTGPLVSEIETYARRLKELKEAGAQIPLVQIYSATRPTPHSECGHLPLKTLSSIARRVQEVAGLKAEVF
jgi:wyosine [tRNA(Phe)-imidazoG37] synthetase (radical SAM superfamily)